MAGRAGELLTGHSLLRLRDGVISGREDETASTTVHFGSPEPADLAAYIAAGEPLGVAGGFTLDGLGGWFVDRIEGDPSNVIGLSLPLLRRLLRRVGLSVAGMGPADTDLRSEVGGSLVTRLVHAHLTTARQPQPREQTPPRVGYRLGELDTLCGQLGHRLLHVVAT